MEILARMNTSLTQRIPLLLLSLLLLSACQTNANAVSAEIANAAPVQQAATDPAATPTLASTLEPTPTLAATASVTPTPTVTPIYTGDVDDACGTILPLLPANTSAETTTLSPDSDAVAAFAERLPDAALPAFEQMLDDPANVGMALYRLGDEANGAFLNADTPMPLASVVKVITLAAYAEAVAAGELDPLSAVTLDALEAYYLPGSDLGSHERAVTDLREMGRMYGDPETMSLEDIVWMMMRHSSNAATDYLHAQLGQVAIEETAARLDLPSQTAPCPFLGQFLTMANHTRTTNDSAALDAYLADPASYGSEISQLTAAYANDEAFRSAEQTWRRQERRPRYTTQYDFSHAFNAHGSARDYARLMSTFALNGLSHPDASYFARRALEWPMAFEDNQAVFTNLGYKNGSLPGILTVAYYAYPREDTTTTPVVITLFYRNLPNDTYRSWRDTLPHDELARWLLTNPDAIGDLREILADS